MTKIEKDLELAAAKGEIEQVKKLLNANNRRQIGSNKPLQAAIRGNHFPTVKLLLEHSDLEKEYCYIALTYACEKGDITLIKNILDLGVDVNAYDSYPLRHACRKADIEVAKLLLQYGGDPQANNHSALRWAHEEKRHELIELIMQFYPTPALQSIAQKDSYPKMEIQAELKRRQITKSLQIKITAEPEFLP